MGFLYNAINSYTFSFVHLNIFFSEEESEDFTRFSKGSIAKNKNKNKKPRIPSKTEVK